MANQDASGWLYVPYLEACCWWQLDHCLQLHENLKTKDTINIAMEIEHITVQSDFHVLQSCIEQNRSLFEVDMIKKRRVLYLDLSL